MSLGALRENCLEPAGPGRFADSIHAHRCASLIGSAPRLCAVRVGCAPARVPLQPDTRCRCRCSAGEPHSRRYLEGRVTIRFRPDSVWPSTALQRVVRTLGREDPAAQAVRAREPVRRHGAGSPANPETGALNYVTPADRVAAAGLVRRGQVFSLASPSLIRAGTHCRRTGRGRCTCGTGTGPITGGQVPGSAGRGGVRR